MQPLLLALNHLLRQEPWAQAMLRPFAGRVAHFDLAPFSLSLQVDAGGLVTSPELGVEPAVRVVVPLAAAVGDYATGGQAAVLKHVRIDGEAEFANVLSTLLRNVRWDAAEDLSRVFGDVLAQRCGAGRPVDPHRGDARGPFAGGCGGVLPDRRAADAGAPCPARAVRRGRGGRAR